MTAAHAPIAGVSFEAVAIKPPAHPKYDLKGIIKLALAEDAGNQGDVTCMATTPFDMEVEAHFLAEDSITAGIALAKMVFQEVDPSLKVETWTHEEVKEVLKYASQTKSSLTRIMLDYIILPLPSGDVDVSMLKEAVELINGKFETEASGNVTLETVHKIGQTGVTYISSGGLTHSVKALDIYLKIDTELALDVGRRVKRP